MESSLILVEDSHIQELDKNSPTPQLLEVQALGFDTVYQAARESVDLCQEVFTIERQGQVLGIMGVMGYSPLSDTACPFLMSTVHFKKYPRDMMRITRAGIDRWSSKWGVLDTIIDSRYDDTVRWMKWLGFDLYGLHEVGGAPFYKATYRRT